MQPARREDVYKRQPTELVKISLILFVAVFIAELGTRINKLRPTLVIIGF